MTRLGEDPKRLTGRPEFHEALKLRKLNLPQFFQQIGTRKLNLRPFLTEHGLISTKKVQRRESWERSLLTRYLAPLFRAPDPDVKVGRSGGDAFIQMAGCCVPLYGDPIAGVQKEHGITIHRVGCAMLAHADPAQRITVGWDVDAGKSSHRITVTAADKAGVIYQIGKIMHSLGVSIHEIATNRDTAAGLATISLNIEPVTSKTFQKIVARLRGLKEVKSVQ